MTTRENITKAFAEWTAFSATRSGCPVKSASAVYPLIRLPNYNQLLGGGEISVSEFDAWHKANTETICNQDRRLPVGWATKIINVYLKTRAYLPFAGRQGLITCLHPPIDNKLWAKVRSKYSDRQDIIEKTHLVERIKDIDTYDRYRIIIEGFKLIAAERHCNLIEVDELWEGWP